jgi:hypothetical protein
MWREMLFVARVVVGARICGVLLSLCLLTAPAAAFAEDAATLLQMVRDSHSFRVRARAALALAHVDDPRVPASLEAALLDTHAAVRAAAASALADSGTVRAVPALRRACADSAPVVAEGAKAALHAIAAREAIHHAVASAQDERVRAPSTAIAHTPALSDLRYAVVLGEMRNQSELQDRELPTVLGERIAAELRALSDVAVFAPAALTPEVMRELARRKVPLLRFEGSLTHVVVRRELGQASLHCEVSLLLLDEPARTLRSSLKGGATSTEQARGPAAQEQAVLIRKTLRNAVRSALANAERAMQSAASQHEPSAGDSRAEAELGGRLRNKRAHR